MPIQIDQNPDVMLIGTGARLGLRAEGAGAVAFHHTSMLQIAARMSAHRCRRNRIKLLKRVIRAHGHP